MSTYYAVLKKLAESNKNERMPCTSVEHIQQWYSIVLNHSYSEIRIFAKDLNYFNNIYLLDILDKFLSNPWKTIKILLKEDCDLSWLNQISGDNLEIKIATGSYSKPDAKEFTVADASCFRFEARPDLGIINFNHYDDSIELVSAFDQAFALGYIKVKKVESNNE